MSLQRKIIEFLEAHREAEDIPESMGGNRETTFTQGWASLGKFVITFDFRLNFATRSKKLFAESYSSKWSFDCGNCLRRALEYRPSQSHAILLVLIAQLKGNRRKIGSFPASPLSEINRSDSYERSQAKQGEIKFPVSQTHKFRAQRKINEGEIIFRRFRRRQNFSQQIMKKMSCCVITSIRDSLRSRESLIDDGAESTGPCRSTEVCQSGQKTRNFDDIVALSTFGGPKTRFSRAYRDEMRS